MPSSVKLEEFSDVDLYCDAPSFEHGFDLGDLGDYSASICGSDIDSHVSEYLEATSVTVTMEHVVSQLSGDKDALDSLMKQIKTWFSEEDILDALTTEN